MNPRKELLIWRTSEEEVFRCFTSKMMQKGLLLLLLAGLVVAKPSFDGDDDELIETLVNQPHDQQDKDVPDQHDTPLNSKEEDSVDFSIFLKFIHYLTKVSIGKVRPDEHPDRKYIKPGMKLVKRLLVVREAVIGTFEPAVEIGKLLIQDHKEMMRKLVRAARQQNMFRAKHIVGEYFIALNRRLVLLLVHAKNAGLFKGVGRNRRGDEVHLHHVKRELEDQANKAHQAIRFILENFNEYRISDGLLDAPFVRLGVETIKVFIRAWKQAVKVGKVTSQYYIDMITDIVRLALVEKKHEAAIQRAGAGILSGIRRDCKTIVAIQRWYVQRKCYEHGGGYEDEPEQKAKPEENSATPADA